MDPLPLIPKSKIKGNNDACHVIREAFQDVLDGKIYPKNISENITKYNVDHKSLKVTATAVELAHTNVKIHLDEITDVETDLMTKQGKHLISESLIKNDCEIQRFLQLRRYPVFEDIDEERAKKFGLIQKLDLLPSKPERALDFRVNSNRHLCTPPCPKLDLIPTKLEKGGRQKSKTPEGISPPPIFQAYPDRIVFENYVVGQTYEKKFTIKNTSKSTGCLQPRLPQKSPFKLELVSKSFRIAAGMKAVFRVTFHPIDYQDVQENLTFCTYTEHDLTVKLVSYRSAPNLHAYVFKTFGAFCEKLELNQNRYFDEERASALNWTVDFGSVLLGDEVNLSLILKNDGGPGRFFLISEDEWNLFYLNAISKRMELTTGCFQIFPVYFKMEEEQFVEISAKFFPITYGLQAEKCVLLCDNTSYEEIDLIGDGIVYEPYFIRIEAPRKIGNTSYVDSESEYYLYLGNCLSFSRQMIILTVHNDSCLDLDYRWEIKKSVCYLETTKLKRMEPSWVEIKHERHQFPANSTTDFEIIVSMNTYEEGQYSIVLRLCIENVPEISLAEGVNFMVFEKEKDPDAPMEPTYVDVIAGDVEISCVIESVHLIIEPPQMIFPIILNYKDCVTKKIQLLTNGKFNLHCKWKLVSKEYENHTIKIVPSKFTLHPEKTVICELTVIPKDYEDIREKLILEINNGVYKKEYYVMAKVEKPTLRFSCSALNFGHIPLGTSAQKTFDVRSLSREHIVWRIVEFTYDFEEMEIVEIENDKQLSKNCGSFDYYGETSTITYSVEGKENHRWFSFLMLLSSHPTQIAMDSICLVTYEVCQPQILISCPSDTPILCPRELLFLGITTSYEICLHNRGNINGYFIWGKTVGSDSHCVEVTAEPRAGILRPDACSKITISLTPTQMGIFEHIYLPCFVGRMNEPLMLTILCAVDNVHVNFFLPQKDGTYLKVLWPEKIIADVSDYELAAVEYTQSGEEGTFEQAQFMSYERMLLELQRRYHEQIGCEESRTPLPDSLGSIVTLYENKMCDSDEKGTVSIPSDSCTSTATLPEKVLTTESLVRCFKSDLVLQKNVIEISHVPIQTLTKTTFIIQNVTPIEAHFNVEPFNFGTEGIKHRNIVDDALVKLKIKQRNEWEELITTNSGIVIKPEPLSGTIPAFESVEVDLFIYANTWGVYVEEVWIEINDIAPFCFTLLVQIVGNPIEFPFAMNTIQEEPVLRFGYIQYESEPVTRKLKVRNISAIPLHLHWEGFLNDTTNINNSSFTSESYTYNSSINNIDRKCMRPDYGFRNSEKIFKIKPKKIMIQPKTTVTIHVTFIPKYFNAQFLKQQIEALITGHIHIKDEYLYQPNYLSRTDGTQTPPPQVKVLAAVELPLLKLDLIGGSTNLKVSANEIIINNTKTFTIRLVFKNNNKSDAIVSMHTTEPFKLISLRTLQMKEKAKADGASVKPDECLEVYIECTLLSEDVIKMYDMLYKYEEVSQDEKINLDNYSISVSRYLNIHQKGVIQQFVPLQITIYYPIIEVSEEIDFGVIFAGNTKKLTMPIYNQSCAQVHFKIIPPSCDEFVVTPLEGVIGETRSVNRQFYNITIYFTPICNKRHKDHLSIVTNVSNYSMDVTLKGTGSYNEKFYSDIL